jgi:hypothetical protein
MTEQDGQGIPEQDDPSDSQSEQLATEPAGGGVRRVRAFSLEETSCWGCTRRLTGHRPII